eukprot:3641736-Ditylum_brightwellii.AAC.1
MAICTYAVPVMRYTFGVIKWNKGELLKLDRKMCKLLTTHGIHHPWADVNRIYLHQAEGGCGLTGLWDTYAHESTALMQYIQESNDPLTSMIPTASTPIVNRLNRFSQGQQCRTPKQTHDNHHAELHQKKPHSQFFVQQRKMPQ